MPFFSQLLPGKLQNWTCAAADTSFFHHQPAARPAGIVKRSDLVGVNLLLTILPARSSDNLLAFAFAIVRAVNSPLRGVLLLLLLLRSVYSEIRKDRIHETTTTMLLSGE